MFAAAAPLSPSIAKRRYRMPEVVKSAVRALEILEFFDRWQGPAQIGTVAVDLGYPQSSTSALMRSLVKVGYLTYDSKKRTYLPTERVPLLGSWIGSSFFSEGPVLAAMHQLAEQTGLTVILGRRNGGLAQWVHVITSQDCGSRTLADIPRELPRNALGHVLLALLNEPQIRTLMHRLNADAESLASVVRPSVMLEQVKQIRAKGYAYTGIGQFGMLAMPLPCLGKGDRNLALALFGNSLTMKDKLQTLTERMGTQIDGMGANPLQQRQ